MKNLILFLFLIISTGIQAQKMIHELPAKTNADSTWLILTGNPSTGRLYKMNFDNLKDSVIGATGSTFDSTSLSNRIDLKLNATDTASLSARINAIGVGGGEDLDATLAIGNTTDEQVIFHDNLGATPTSTSYIPIIIRPLENDPDQLDFRFERNTTFQNGGTTINNEVLHFGFNVNAQTPGLPGLYESWESGYYPGADRWLEKHEVYAKSDLTQVRLSSYTINTATNDIDFYHTVNRFYLNDSVGNYFKVESNVSTDASKLTLTSTDGTAGITIETNGTDNAIYVSSLINTSSSELQFNAFELIQFQKEVRLNGALSDGNNEVGTPGQLLSTNGAGTDWIDPPSGSVPAGSNTQIQFNNSGVLGGSADFAWDGTSVNLAGHVSAPSLRVGTLEFQNYALSNSWIGDNVYFDGTFNARQTGPSALFYFQGDEGQFRLGASVTAGSAFTQIVPLKVSQSGSVSIGGNTSTTGGNYTGGTALFNNDGMSIGKNGSVPVASALIEMTSVAKGFLPPRMTATQAGAISSPAEGLLVYVTDTDGTFTAKGWWGWEGSSWAKLNN